MQPARGFLQGRRGVALGDEGAVIGGGEETAGVVQQRLVTASEHRDCARRGGRAEPNRGSPNDRRHRREGEQGGGKKRWRKQQPG